MRDGRRAERRGQALAELTVALVVLTLLTVAAVQLAQLCVRRTRLRRDVRAEAGLAALRARADGVAVPGTESPVSIHPLNRVNAYACLAETPLPLVSHLPASHYTLQSRLDADEELGLIRRVRTEAVPVDGAFARLIWPKGEVVLREAVAFPTLGGLTDATASDGN